jgi:hypothetical protein
MKTLDSADLTWVKASKSHADGACVELAVAGDSILLRDSKDPRVHLTCAPAAVRALIDCARGGEFDHLVAGR